MQVVFCETYGYDTVCDERCGECVEPPPEFPEARMAPEYYRLECCSCSRQWTTSFHGLNKCPDCCDENVMLVGGV